MPKPSDKETSFTAQLGPVCIVSTKTPAERQADALEGLLEQVKRIADSMTKPATTGSERWTVAEAGVVAKMRGGFKPTQEELQAVVNEREADEGWTPWSGGDCPVAPETMVEYQMRNEEPPFDTAAASELRWSHESDGSDVVAYRLAGATS